MTIAFDAATTSSGWTTTPDPFTFNHTPVGTPRGVVLLLGAATNTDVYDGTITYGGVNMTRVLYADDSTGEQVSSYIYFLGTSIPTGTQAVSIPHTASGHSKIAFCITVTADGDTEIVDSDILEGDQANPQITLDSGTVTALRCFVIGTGHNSASSLTLISGMSSVGSGTTGTRSIVAARETSPSSGSTTVGWTATSEDVAMSAVAVREISANTTITAGQGTYTITGNAATLSRQVYLTAAQGTYTITGNAATLRRNIPLTAGQGSYSITGNGASLKAGRLLTAAQGSYSITGQAALLSRQVYLSAGQGSYSITGNAASLLRGLLLTAAQGSYTVTGQAANLSRQVYLTAAQGSYNLTGQDVILTYSGTTITLTAGQGAYTITGNPANLLHGYLLTAAQGSYGITGNAAGLLRGLKINTEQGAYTLTGQAANLFYNRLLTALQGSYTVTGQSAALLRGLLLSALQGSYSVTGNPASLLRNYILTAGQGSYTITGINVSFGQGALVLGVIMAQPIRTTYAKGASVIQSDEIISIKSGG